MGLASGLLLQKDLRELVWEDLNYSPLWRRDFAALTTPHTGLTDVSDTLWEENPLTGPYICCVSVAIIFPCSIFLKETRLNTSQPVLRLSGISRMHLLYLFREFVCSPSLTQAMYSYPELQGWPSLHPFLSFPWRHLTGVHCLFPCLAQGWSELPSVSNPTHPNLKSKESQIQPGGKTRATWLWLLIGTLLTCTKRYACYFSQVIQMRLLWEYSSPLQSFSAIWISVEKEVIKMWRLELT